METNKKANSKTDFRKEKVCTNGPMAINMRGNGNRGKCIERVSTRKQVETDRKASSKTTYMMEKAIIS